MSAFLIGMTLPMLIFMGILLGLSQLFTPFGILYALPVLALVITATIAERLQKPNVAIALLLTAIIGPWFSFLSWILSRRPLIIQDTVGRWASNTASVATAGFPITALALPPSPMGGDRIPMDMWIGVFANRVIWMLIALMFSVVLAVYAKKIRIPKNLFPIAITLGILATLSNLALFGFWYD